MTDNPPFSDAGDAAGLPPNYEALLLAINMGSRLSGESPSASVIRWQRELEDLRARVRALEAECRVKDNAVAALQRELSAERHLHTETLQRLAETATCVNALEAERDECERENEDFTQVIHNCEASDERKQIRINELEAQKAAGEAERAALLQRLLDTRDVIDRHVPRGVLEPLLEEFDRLWADLLAAGRSASPQLLAHEEDTRGEKGVGSRPTGSTAPAD